jgi:dTDP-glucose 4,6-dehydratase
MLSRPTFRFLQHDITRPLEPAGPIDYVLHFASPASPVDYLRYPIETLQVGSLGTFHALEIAKAKKARFLLASTSEVYGDPEVHPQPEGYWGHVNPIGPRGVYDEAKRFAEALTMATHRQQGVDTRIVRIFNTFGPRMRMDDGRAIPNFITQALSGRPITVYGDGSQTRSFCYMTDLIDGIQKLMESNLHEPVNIGNPNEISLLELAKKVLHLTKSASPLVFKPLPVDDPKVRCPDSTRAREELKWIPRIGLEEGLLQTIHWFRQLLLRE